MQFWETRGHYSEGRGWLEKALEDEERAPAAVRAKALYAMCQMAHLQNDTDTAEMAAREGIEVIAEAKIDGGLAAALRWKLGYALRLRGDYERAKELLEESLALSKEADDRLGVAGALLELAAIYSFLGDRVRAKGLYEMGIVVCREVGYTFQLTAFLSSLGYTLLLEGDFERGAALIEEAAALVRERGYKGGLEGLVDNVGWAALLQGDHERARSSYQESLTLCKELGDKMITSESLEGLACISATEGATGRAARLFGAAEALREAVGYHHMPEEDAWREPYLAAVRSQLDDASREEAWAEGRAMSFDEAVSYAMDMEEAGG